VQERGIVSNDMRALGNKPAGMQNVWGMSNERSKTDIFSNSLFHLVFFGSSRQQDGRSCFSYQVLAQVNIFVGGPSFVQMVLSSTPAGVETYEQSIT
jgi:hypothetical protein